MLVHGYNPSERLRHEGERGLRRWSRWRTAKVACISWRARSRTASKTDQSSGSQFALGWARRSDCGWRVLYGEALAVCFGRNADGSGSAMKSWNPSRRQVDVRRRQAMEYQLRTTHRPDLAPGNQRAPSYGRGWPTTARGFARRPRRARRRHTYSFTSRSR